MDAKTRAALIRQANEFFNNGEYTKAEKIFVKTSYKDGLVRIGDHLYYDKKLPLAAYKYYKLANSTKKIKEIFERMVFALKKIMSEDEEQKTSEVNITLEPVKVHPKLKLAAEEILRDSQNA